MLRALLLELAKSSRLRRWITSNGATRRMARRFVPGEELAPAIEAARACNKAGMTVSLDHLGENVVTREDAERARASYTEALDQIAAAGIEGNVSLKLTHLGLDLGGEFCAEQLRIVTRRAEELGNFVRVDMEGSAYTDRTLRMVKQARAETAAVGTVIQAYLYRSEEDIRELLGIGCRIRLVKGRVQGALADRVSPQERCRRKFHQADEDPAAERNLPRPGHARPEDDRGRHPLRRRAEHHQG